MSAKEIKVYWTSWGRVRTAQMRSWQIPFVSKSDYDSLKADLERMVKMYGDKKNWGHSQYELGSMQSPFGDITIKDLSAPDENLNCHGGKLAREIGKKWGIKYE